MMVLLSLRALLHGCRFVSIKTSIPKPYLNPNPYKPYDHGCSQSVRENDPRLAKKTLGRKSRTRKVCILQSTAACYRIIVRTV